MSIDMKLGSSPLLTDQGKIVHFADGVHLLQLWSNVCIIESAEGVVIFDAGFEFYGPRIVKELRALTEKPVRYIVYGHGHGDHAFGAPAIITDAQQRGLPRPIIVAHEDLPRRFDRYREMLAYHEHINRLQFSIPDKLPAFPRNYVYPDLTYRDAMSLSLGNLTFELRHAAGETDDTTWMFVPEKKLVCSSDLWVWSCPNIGNPFKVQRYETEWAAALETIAATGAELLLPGHGPALQGAAEIKSACLIVARALRHLHDEVVGMLNQGKWPEEILHSFTWPDEFAQSPYLASIYGHPSFIVAGILRRYHGWYDGNASHLFPASTSEIATEIAALADPARILARARDLAAANQLQLALHLLDFIIDANHGLRPDALAEKARLLDLLATAEPSLIARNIFLSGIRQIKKERSRK
jgi:alkyl sulfatase BDS1-like metallo-beta-lactamase superfamily hydrolase